AQETYLANAPVAVTGKVAFPEANAEFSVTWSALALPAGSQAAFTDGDKLNSAFAPDLPGTYTLELRVNSEKWGTFTSTTQINLREPRPFDCEHEEKVHAPKQGSMAVEAFSAYVPACRGWVYLTHPEKNTVELRNVFTNQQGANYQLSASPLSLVLDPAKHVLYATTASSSLFKIDLDKNEVSEISLEFSAQTVALMGNDLLLATQTDIYQKGAKISAVIDGKSGKTLKTFSDFGKQWFSGYSAAAQKLFLSDDSESWNLTQYSFDRDSLQFTKDVAVSNQSIWNASMVISDNGLHIAGLKTDGAAGFLGISDYSASDIRRMLGAWQNRNTPICGPMAFSHDSKSLFVGCTGSIYRYAADSHQLLSTMDVLPLYLVNGWENMGVSQGNRIVFALSKRYERNPTIYWVLIN
ncbi:MAG: YncE family protein, partial [Bdellovibrionota bacterium]